MPHKKGKFIVFEGIDGSGKGTIIGMAAEFLGGCGVPAEKIAITKEPTTGKFGKKIREILSGNEPPEAHSEELLKLYVEDRRTHVKTAIEPAVLSGKIVLCDRYKYSTIAYQCAQGIQLEQTIEPSAPFPIPDLTIILDIPVPQALERITNDARRARLEKFEQQQFLETVRQNFLRLPQLLPEENIQIIDASLPKEGVFEQVQPLLEMALR